MYPIACDCQEFVNCDVLNLLAQAGSLCYLKIFFEPEIEAGQGGDVGAQAHHEEKFGEDDGCYWDDREGIAHRGVVVEDFVCDEGDGGGADAESDEIYDEQIKCSGLAAHGVGDELDNRCGDQAGGHAAEENCDVEKRDHGVRLRRRAGKRIPGMSHAAAANTATRM